MSAGLSRDGRRPGIQDKISRTRRRGFDHEFGSARQGSRLESRGVARPNEPGSLCRLPPGGALRGSLRQPIEFLSRHHPQLGAHGKQLRDFPGGNPRPDDRGSIGACEQEHRDQGQRNSRLHQVEAHHLWFIILACNDRTSRDSGINRVSNPNRAVRSQSRRDQRCRHEIEGRRGAHADRRRIVRAHNRRRRPTQRRI